MGTHSTDVLPTTRTHHVGLFPPPPLNSLLLLKCSQVEAPAGSSCSSPVTWTYSSRLCCSNLSASIRLASSSRFCCSNLSASIRLASSSPPPPLASEVLVFLPRPQDVWPPSPVSVAPQ